MRVLAAGKFLQGVPRNLLVGLLERVAVGFVFLVPAIEMEEHAERDGDHVQPQDGHPEFRLPADHHRGQEPDGDKREGDLHQVAQYGVVQLLVAFLVHLHELADRGLLAILRQRRDVVDQREEAQQGEHAYARLHGTGFAHLQQHAKYKFCTK